MLWLLSNTFLGVFQSDGDDAELDLTLIEANRDAAAKIAGLYEYMNICLFAVSITVSLPF